MNAMPRLMQPALLLGSVVTMLQPCAAGAAPVETPGTMGRLLAVPAPAVVAAAAERPLATIPALDLPRYMGRWHEIARFPNWFQKKCVAAATADYSLQADGRVRVVNCCRKADGSLSVAEAEGRRAGPAGSAKLEVRFAPAWLSFLPFVWGKYWVVDLDADYRLVAVGEPGRDYLWILARSPAVSRADYEALVARLAAKGFDVSKLQVTGTIE
jgi:apolipoprotein D and lipocalin family protein